MDFPWAGLALTPGRLLPAGSLLVMEHLDNRESRFPPLYSQSGVSEAHALRTQMICHELGIGTAGLLRSQHGLPV